MTWLGKIIAFFDCIKWQIKLYGMASVGKEEVMVQQNSDIMYDVTRDMLKQKGYYSRMHSGNMYYYDVFFTRRKSNGKKT